MARIREYHAILLVLLALYGAAGLAARYPSIATIWAIFAVYLLLVVGVFRGHRRLIQFSVLPPLLLAGWTGAMVVVNLWMFLTGHPLYLDSPATIFIVVIIAAVVTAPAAVVLASYWRHRREIFGLGKG